MTGQNAFQSKYRLRGSVKLSIQSILRLPDKLMMQLSLYYCIMSHVECYHYLHHQECFLTTSIHLHPCNIGSTPSFMSSFICYDESTLGTCISLSCSATKLKISPSDRAYKTTYGTSTFHFYPQGTRGR